MVVESQGGAGRMVEDCVVFVIAHGILECGNLRTFIVQQL